MWKSDQIGGDLVDTCFLEEQMCRCSKKEKYGNPLSFLDNEAALLRRCTSYLYKEAHCQLDYLEWYYVLVRGLNSYGGKDMKPLIKLIPSPIRNLCDAIERASYGWRKVAYIWCASEEFRNDILKILIL